MKKNIFALAILAVATVACNKNESNTVTTEETTIVEHTDPTPNDMQDQPITHLALSESFWDFKDVKKGETVQHIYEVTNTGKNPLIISQVKPACGCTAPDYTKDPILPGEKGQITLSFDSSNFDGLQTKQAEVFANVETSPIIISFSANVIN